MQHAWYFLQKKRAIQIQLLLFWGIGRAATLLKTLLQYYGKSIEALPGVAYPGFRDNCSTLNTKTR